jgi:16S rRNA processing protein RimM
LKQTHRPLYAVGTIVKVFGIRGEVIVQPVDVRDRGERFASLNDVYIGRTEENAVEARVEAVDVGRRGVRMKLIGVDDRNAATPLVGRYVFVDEKNLRRVPKGTYLVHQLVGMTVVDEEGRNVGLMKTVLKFPAQDVYVIEADGKEILIPAVKEFIGTIDVEKRTMRVRLIEGMDGQ